MSVLYYSLEAATSRLEDIATSTELPKDTISSINDKSTSSPADASAASTSPPPPPLAPASAPAPKASTEPLPESVEEFDALLNSTVDKYVKLSDQIGGLVAKQVRDMKYTTIRMDCLLTICRSFTGRRRFERVSGAAQALACC